MNNDKLYVLISTIDSRILNLKSILQSYSKNVYYIISHQVNNQLDHKNLDFIDELIERRDVKYSLLKGKGVAKNRNNTLRFLEPSSVCLILDDDVVLFDNTFDRVISSFNMNASVDFISFKILDLDGNDYKSYPKKKKMHTLGTLTGIGTTEIAFKSDLILNAKVRFDENFGPGSDSYPIGEDFIFAMDLYKMKTKMLFLPMAIVTHPMESTGKSLNQKIIFGRGAMFARVFGRKAFLINFLFAFKKYPDYRKKMSLWLYVSLLHKGTIHYFRMLRKVLS